MAYLIYCNNVVQAVVLDDEARAEAKMLELREQDFYSVKKWNKKDFDFLQYSQRYFWCIREVSVI